MKEIEDYINKNDWRLKENSNFNYSYPDFVSYLAGHDIANYYLKNLYPKEIADLHKQGYIHIHDMSHLCNYCLGADLLLLISNGIKTKDITCNPAKHFSSICGQLVNWLISLQLENAGAIAINDIDILLTPFTVNDHLSQKQIKQHLQELIFSINIPCRWGQTPFINMNLAFKCPKYLKNVPVIIGGKNQGYTYGEIKKDDLMDFQKAFLEVLIEQGKKGIPFTFPITTINFTRGFFSWELKDLIYELVKTTGMPYFLNLYGSDLTGEESKSLCCRLNLNMKELYKNSGGRFGAGTSTGSNNVVDINLPLIAQNKEDFWKSFDEILEQAMLCNIIKRKTIDGLFEQGLYPFLNKAIPNFKNFFLTISVQGGYDAFQMLEGEKDYVLFAKKILEKINIKILEYQKKTGYLFNVECYDKETEILTENGWKYFKDLDENETIMTLNPKTKTIEHQQIEDKIEYHYKGEMYHIKDRSLDLLITPRHKIPHVGRKDILLTEIKNIKNCSIPKRVKWESEEKDIFELPAFINKKRGSKYQNGGSIKIKMDDWLSFFGLWIAEGWVRISGQNYMVEISIDKKRVKKQFLDLIKKLPWCWRYDEKRRTYKTINRQLYNYLLPMKGAPKKYIPKEYKKLSNRQLKILFDWYIKGDGHVDKNNGRISMVTVSKKLRDDLIEIIIKIGYGVTYHVKSPCKGGIINGRQIVGKHEINLIYVNISKTHTLMPKNIKKVQYDDKVYCVTVPNHIIFVRRNNKVSWCGNCAPAEGASFRFIKHLKNFDKEYVTNGLALPVDFSDDIFDFIKVYNEIFPMYTGGSLFPIYVGEKLDNNAIESLLRVMSKTKIPYFAISPDFTICNKCDKISFGKKEKCSKCQSEDVDYISRVVGYYRRTSKWNVGKNAEFKDRKKLI